MKKGDNGETEDILSILSILERRHWNIEDLKKLLESQKPLGIPVSIFNSKASPLGALCIYLKDFKGLNYSRIAELLCRDPRTIWVTYRREKPHATDITINTDVMVPIEIFAKRQLSVMEGLVLHLKQQRCMRLSDIAKLLGRSSKTVWCFFRRGLEKNAR